MSIPEDRFARMARIVIYKQVVAEKVAIEQRRSVPLYNIANVQEPEAYIDQLAGSLMVSLRMYVAGMGGKRIDVERQFPATWWEAVKERWFPGWLEGLFPVKYERISIHEHIYGAVCPHLLVPHDGKVCIEWLLQRQEDANHSD